MTAMADIEFESGICRGLVRHRRFSPSAHEFEYPLFMLWLKVEEIPLLLSRFRLLGSRPWHWARFRRQDYIGPEDQSIDAAVRSKMAQLLDIEPAALAGDVFMLCHLRYFGFYFSPLNLYYLRQQGHFRYLLAEVSNTPWNERHYYLLDLDDLKPHDKAFHVSPFNPMDQAYRWRITPPTAAQPRCLVHIQSHQGSAAGEKIFDATLALKRREFTQSNLTRALLRTPAQTLSVVLGIYWQAFRLWLKRVPFFGHPRKVKIDTGKGTL